MFGKSSGASYDSLGTTPPIFVMRDQATTPVKPGKTYFYVKIYGAQAVFRGSLLTRVNRLIVTSAVSLSRSGLLEPSLLSIQRSREVKPDSAYQLGIQTDLIALVPAVMSRVSISIEFLLDQQDRLAALAGLINDNSFQSILSLAPGAGQVAKTVSSLAQKVIQTLIPSEERQPILQLSADFNLVGDEIGDGYYVVLASRDPANPLPKPLPEMSVQNGELLLDGRPVTNYSYVILEVRATPARTRDLNDGAEWENKLREAEGEAALPMGSDEDSWDKCRALIRAAQILLRSDPNYLREEADAIIISSIANCRSKLRVDRQERSGGPGAASAPAKIITGQDLAEFGLPEDLEASKVLRNYGRQVVESRARLEEYRSTDRG